MERLRARRWPVQSSSSRQRRAARLVDMIAACLVKGSRSDVAHVDVFSGNAFWWAEISAWALRRSGCPYILTLHGGNLPAFARRWPHRVDRLLRSAAAVTAPSGYLAEAMRRFRGDVLLLPNGIDLAAYPCRVRPGAAPRLVWIRSFHRMYDPALAIKVVAALSAQHPQVQLVMVGPDRDGTLSDVRRLAARMDVSSRVRFVPGVAKHEVPKYLSDADIFLNTTTVDNMPVTLLEAMACGLSVISTSAGGVPWLVQHERNGLLVDAGDEAGMTAAVERVLADPTFAGALMKNARAFAENFDWSAILPRWQQLLAAHARNRYE
jgi:glycosyltransferase involved in cell wall biosynthesis